MGPRWGQGRSTGDRVAVVALMPLVVIRAPWRSDLLGRGNRFPSPALRDTSVLRFAIFAKRSVDLGSSALEGVQIRQFEQFGQVVESPQ